MAKALLCCLLLGVILGALYDFFRLLRLCLCTDFIFDFLFWLISAFSFFTYLLAFNSGEIRAYYFFLCFGGYMLYILTIGRLTLVFELRCAKMIKNRLNKVKKCIKSFKKVLQNRFGLLYNILNYKYRFAKFKRLNKEGNIYEQGKEQR